MILEETYATAEEVPAEYAALYTEKAGKMVLTGVKGVMLSHERDALKNEAAQNRIKANEANRALSEWSTLGESPDAVRKVTGRVKELEIMVEGNKGDQETVDKLVKAKVAGIKADFDRDLGAMSTKAKQMNASLEAYENQARQVAIVQAATKAAGGLKTGKISSEAMEDMLMFAGAHLKTVEERDENGTLQITGVISKDGVGVTPGQDASVWIGEMTERKSHWLSDSHGGGSKGTKGSRRFSGNPWALKDRDIDAEAEFVREHGKEKAKQAAAAAGKKFG